MWMRTPAGGLVAALYGPSVESIAVNGGTNKLCVTEATNYPFSDSVAFTFKTARPVTLPFMFRIPGWCEKPRVTINGDAYSGATVPGTFVTVQWEFRDGDTVVVTLPMKTKLVKWDRYGFFVERGPLLFTYPVPEKVTVDTKVYPNLKGKKAWNPDFPALDIRPNGPWNYALDIDPARVDTQVCVVMNNTTGYPFDPGSVPLVLKVPAHRVEGWELDQNRYTPHVPQPPKVTGAEKTETITLVPYGSTRLRLTVFPSTVAAKP